MPRLSELMEECPELRVMLFSELTPELLEQAEQLLEDTKKLWRQHEEVRDRWAELGRAIVHSSSEGVYIN